MLKHLFIVIQWMKRIIYTFITCFDILIVLLKFIESIAGFYYAIKE